jgi:hypothetical protein
LVLGVYALGVATLYEFLLVGLESYGYSLTRKSSYLIFFNAVLLGFLSQLLFLTYRRAIRVGRLLHPEAWMTVGIAGGAATLYWMWAVDRWLRLGLMGSESAGFTLSPAAIIDYAVRFHGKGFWGWGIAWYYDRATVNGTALTVWWTLEAAVVLLIPSAKVWLFLRKHPLCDRCGSWMWVNEGVRRMPGSRATVVHEGLRSSDLSPLEEVDRPSAGDPFTLRIDLAKCQVCPDAVYVTLLHDRKILLWMHPIPASQMQKVFRPVRKKQPG